MIMEVQLLKASKPENKTIQFCGYCKRYTEHIKNICQKCGSDNTKIQGFNPNLM